MKVAVQVVFLVDADPGAIQSSVKAFALTPEASGVAVAHRCLPGPLTGARLPPVADKHYGCIIYFLLWGHTIANKSRI